jgi:hypothetical protein
MSTSIDQTLDSIVDWYEDHQLTNERAQLLSKLAVLELCGWLEGFFDSVVMEVDSATIADSDWVAKSVLASVHGFDYVKHLRPMLKHLLGEIVLRRVESRLEGASPGDLDRLKGLLALLWKTRCEFAHSDLVTNIASQRTFNAPSWSRTQLSSLQALMSEYRTHLLLEVAQLNGSAS